MQYEEDFVDVILLYFSRSNLHLADPLDCEILHQARAKPVVAQNRETNRLGNNPTACTTAFAFYYEITQKK